MRGFGFSAVLVCAACVPSAQPSAVGQGRAVETNREPADRSSSERSQAEESRPEELRPEVPVPDALPSGPATSVTSTPPPEPPRESLETGSTALEVRQCSERGGTIQPVCMSGYLTCVVRYRDGGKRCTDKRDCTGECLYEGSEPAPAMAVGSCQRTNDPCGCKAPIKHGTVQSVVCVD